MEQVRSSSRHNEMKLKLLTVILKTRRYLTTPMIARKCGISTNNASARMKRYVGQGYCWRRNLNAVYAYKYLKPMGERVCEELWIRAQMQKRISDPRIVLNLKKKVPVEYQKLHKELSEEYQKWLEE